MTTSDPLTQSAMLDEEKAHVRSLRGEGEREHDFIGLALSGGGIRSATFNLGILQALARHDTLRHFDYLSTVSGGGYIGSWLSALIQRTPGGLAAVEAALRPHPPRGEEAPPLRFLRRYSNYLTPKTGLLSGDTLAAIATYLRNFGLNLIIIVAMIAAFVVGMHLLAHLARWAVTGVGPSLPGTALALIMGVTYGCARGLATTAAPGRDPAAAHPAWAWAILLPALAAGILVALAMVGGHFGKPQAWQWALGGGGVYGVTWLIGFLLWGHYAKIAASRNVAHPFGLGVLILLAGAVAGVLFGRINDGVLAALPGASDFERAWWAVTVTAPLVVLVVAATAALTVGLLRRNLSHEAREWWSRLGGLLLGAVALWSLAFTLAGLAPPLVIGLQGWIAEIGGLWAVITGAGVWLAKSPLTGNGEGKGRAWAEAGARAAPYVFVTGFVVGISALTYLIFTGQYCPNCQPVAATAQKSVITACPLCTEIKTLARPFGDITANVFTNMGSFDPRLLALAFIACTGVFVLAGWRFDINLFSIHHFYRNRLVRAYLGATRFPVREFHPFTGFSPDDDIRLCCLNRQRPFHIINTTLNLSGGDELAWQTRRATSFTFTPLHCGFEYRTTRGGDADATKALGGYRPTAEYQSRWGAYLGTAMSISGAAASPLAGYHTEAALATLMTVFNVRLGQWLGNPAHHNAWKLSSPKFAGRYLLKELAASADARSDFLYLSDGGHFENLGLYELVRRRCRLIVACDAGCDPDYSFDDLANAIRKCYIDLGATIEIDVDDLRPSDAFRHTTTHHAAGVIRYADASEGVLLYLKASLTGREAPDILNYAANHKAFPHDTTADQFFDEDQFESYRKLGYQIGDGIFGDIQRAAQSVQGQFDAAALIAQMETMATAPRARHPMNDGGSNGQGDGGT